MHKSQNKKHTKNQEPHHKELLTLKKSQNTAHKHKEIMTVVLCKIKKGKEIWVKFNMSPNIDWLTNKLTYWNNQWDIKQCHLESSWVKFDNQHITKIWNLVKKPRSTHVYI